MPVRRVDLYDRCLDGLMCDWQRSDKQRVITRAELTGLRSQIAAAAWKLFPRQIFSEEDFYKACGTATFDRASRERARLEFEQFMLAGLITEAGDDSYLFLHRTFHEFLCANRFADWINKSEAWADVSSKLTEYSALPEWGEIIPLTAGLLERPERLLRWLAEQQDMLFHPLLLQIRCIAEIGIQERARPEVASMIAGIIDQFVTALLYHPAASIFHFADWAHRPFLQQDLSLLVGRLADALGDPSTDIAVRAAEALEDLGGRASSPASVSALAAALSHEDSAVRSTVTRALSAVAQKGSNPELIEELLKSLGDEDALVANSVVDTLGSIKNKALRNKLIDALIPKLGNYILGAQEAGGFL